MKIYYETLGEIFQDLESTYKIVDTPLFTGGIQRGFTQSFHYELENEKKKMLHVQVYRMNSGRYEYNGYIL